MAYSKYVKNIEALREYKRTGDIKLRNKFVEDNIPLIQYFADKITVTGTVCDKEDVFQTLSECMLKAIDSFEDDGTACFSTYFSFWARASHQKRALIMSECPVHIPRRDVSKLKHKDVRTVRIISSEEDKESDAIDLPSSYDYLNDPEILIDGQRVLEYAKNNLTEEEFSVLMDTAGEEGEAKEWREKRGISKTTYCKRRKQAMGILQDKFSYTRG